MQIDKTKSENKMRQERFTKRLDFYWQFMVIYIVVFFVFGILKGSIDEGTFSITLKDPVVILLGIFFLGTLLKVLFEYFKKSSIIVGKDYIVFINRFIEKKYGIHEITRISLGKERFLNMKSSFRLIKIKIRDKSKVIRLRPTSYMNDYELFQAIINLKKQIVK